jgi:hypothetical protein
LSEEFEPKDASEIPEHRKNNWFTHRLKPSIEPVRKLAAAIYAHAVAHTKARFHIVEQFVPSHHNFLGKLIRGYWKKVRVKD